MWTRWALVTALVLGVAVLAFTSGRQSTGIPALSQKAKPKIISKKEFVQLMPQISKWLGVTCGYCHVAGDFEKMTKKKRIALYMKTEFMEKLQTHDGQNITCFTCHQGKAEFLGQTGAPLSP